MNKRLLSAGFALSLGLMSCQETSLITPDKPIATPLESVSVNDIISPNLPQVYKLIKQGDAILAYDSDGRLKSVRYGSDVRGDPNLHIAYTYSAGSIHVVSHIGYSPYYDQTYLIDAKGRCYEYKELKYIYSNSSLTENREIVYTYNAKGQLQTATNKSNAAVRTEYAYNADGDLSRATRYHGSKYSQSPPEIWADYTFFYDQPTGDPILENRYGLYSEVADLPDPYLKIFGPSSKHLVKLITNKLSLGGRYYTYTLNAAGYPTKRDEYSLSSGALVESKSYDYLVTNLTFQL